MREFCKLSLAFDRQRRTFVTTMRTETTTAAEFNKTIDVWIDHLESFDIDQLRIQPAHGQWSLGQVYIHLIENSWYFLKQARRCTTSDRNSEKVAASHGRSMLINNSFPDEPIEGPESNARTAQPESTAQLLSDLVKLKREINEVAALIGASSFKGKARHPGLKYLSAAEWFQFAEMHFRHHLRQKKKLDVSSRTGKKRHSGKWLL